MPDFVKLILSRNDVGQIIDGLTQRKLVWRATAEYFKTGHPVSADNIEECTDEEEADSIADYYEAIIESLKNQLAQQEK